MNYMEQIAQMMGVELGEEFKITCDEHKYRFTEQGLEYFNYIIKEWIISDCLNNILNGSHEIVKIPKPILDAKEKEYLSAVIKPFRDCVKCISKNRFDGFEYIFIVYFSKLGNEDYVLDLPAFEEGTMYKGMEACKHYTLEELGL